MNGGFGDKGEGGRPVTAPLPMLGGDDATAPSVRKQPAVVILATVASFAAPLVAAFIALLLTMAEHPAADHRSIESALDARTGILLLTAVVLNLALGLCMLSRVRAAWGGGLLMAILGLATFPVGTVFSAVILAFWFRRETRAWFGSDVDSSS